MCDLQLGLHVPCDSLHRPLAKIPSKPGPRFRQRYSASIKEGNHTFICIGCHSRGRFRQFSGLPGSLENGGPGADTVTPSLSAEDDLGVARYYSEVDYFIDECGHTGDLAKSSAMTGFDDQPIFSLAAVGVPDDASLIKEIDRLKAKHRVKLSELKSSSLRDRPAFTFDVVDFVCKEAYPFFIEVVDKRFFLTTHIVSRQLLPPTAGLEEDARTHILRNLLADYLHDRAPEDVFAKFVQACMSPSNSTFSAQLTALIEFARANAGSEAIASMLHDLASTTESDYRESLAEEGEKACLNYLPLPDDNKSKKPVWILPNLSSFTNIYTRINLHARGDLSKVRLIHDEQLQYDEILEASKKAAESMREAAALFFTPHSNYDFRQTAALSFASSTRSAGVQVADILAGFSMRYVKDFFANPDAVDPIAHHTYDLLRRATNPVSGIGVNLVVSTQAARALALFTSTAESSM